MHFSLKSINRWWYIGVVIMTLGCGTTEPIGCDPCRTTAIVNVHVSDAVGQPIVGVPLLITTYLTTCGIGFRGGEEGFVTQSEGHRRILISSLFSPHTVECIRLTVNSSLNPNFPSATKELPARLEFRAEDGTPRDSMRLDIVVP